MSRINPQVCVAQSKSDVSVFTSCADEPRLALNNVTDFQSECGLFSLHVLPDHVTASLVAKGVT